MWYFWFWFQFRDEKSTLKLYVLFLFVSWIYFFSMFLPCFPNEVRSMSPLPSSKSCRAPSAKVKRIWRRRKRCARRSTRNIKTPMASWAKPQRCWAGPSRRSLPRWEDVRNERERGVDWIVYDHPSGYLRYLIVINYHKSISNISMMDLYGPSIFGSSDSFRFQSSRVISFSSRWAPHCCSKRWMVMSCWRPWELWWMLPPFPIRNGNPWCPSFLGLKTDNGPCFCLFFPTWNSPEIGKTTGIEGSIYVNFLTF